MVLPKPVEKLAPRNSRPRVGEGFVHALPQPFVKCRLFAIEGTHSRSQNLRLRTRVMRITPDMTMSY